MVVWIGVWRFEPVFYCVHGKQRLNHQATTGKPNHELEGTCFCGKELILAFCLEQRNSSRLRGLTERCGAQSSAGGALTEPAAGQSPPACGRAAMIRVKGDFGSSYLILLSLQQWKWTGGFLKTAILLTRPLAHFHDCWKRGMSVHLKSSCWCDG